MEKRLLILTLALAVFLTMAFPVCAAVSSEIEEEYPYRAYFNDWSMYYGCEIWFKTFTPKIGDECYLISVYGSGVRYVSAYNDGGIVGYLLDGNGCRFTDYFENKSTIDDWYLQIPEYRYSIDNSVAVNTFTLETFLLKAKEIENIGYSSISWTLLQEYIIIDGARMWSLNGEQMEYADLINGVQDRH